MKDLDLSELDLSTIGSWPAAVKAAVVAVVCVAVLALGYFLHIQKKMEQLEQVRAKEPSLKREFEKKQAKAANLDAYKKQMQEMEESFGTMLRQLPSKTEVDDLLIDVSQTGLSSGVEFELFKPQSEKRIEFYAELPIQISMLGTYHQFGKFVSGVAALPRIVTLHDINLTSSKDGRLQMDVTAKTYRYLDENELASAKKKNEKRRR
ncbi:type 4a pilus biogenesis protein PilO [Thiohalophilus sp.]|uniref:type 4a pilus biogenesis protein PilO n=1 Tax=Thiohalophilus sp. TaxID=3028392 RepID=UPI002ACDE423|nr:type 4a pilus biogenesis protein PilO [Thiohalophilus sp.]MDZ7661606.1 type 4a pilus biogenesis protein PilO [Thiohalophilus sp.]MDZ7803577.1 type 4a pilus biogenesis protein PilO [Thiohalophilus sp.]